MNRLFAPLACVAAAAMAAPAPAAPPTPAAAVEQMEAFGLWLKRLQDAMQPMNDALLRFGSAMDRLPDTPADPADLAAEIAAVRASIADVRQAISRTRSDLALIPSFGQKLIGTNVDTDRLLVEAKEQADEMLGYMDDTQALVDAVEKGDAAAIEPAAEKVIRGGFLLLDSQVIHYRARQAMFAPDRSPHQLVGITIQLYRAMSAAGNYWADAHLSGRAAEAAGSQRTTFLTLARELEAILAQGRANLKREKASLVAGRPQAARNPDVARLLAASERMQAVQIGQLAIGDDLLAWLRSRADTPPSVLEAQTSPELIAELSAFEQRLIAKMEEATAVLTGAGR